MEQWAKWASLPVWSIQPIFPFPVRHPMPQPHYVVQRVQQTKLYPQITGVIFLELRCAESNYVEWIWIRPHQGGPLSPAQFRPQRW